MRERIGSNFWSGASVWVALGNCGVFAALMLFVLLTAPDRALLICVVLAVGLFASWSFTAWIFRYSERARLADEQAATQKIQALQQQVAALGAADAELQRAKDKAEAANEAKSRYVVGLSHELRTPLNAVMGYAQILERDATLPENRRGSAQSIRRSAEHLSGLIDGLLDISKIEGGRLQVYANEINIQDFLDQIVDMFRLQAEAKGLEFRHTRAKVLPVHVRTDEKRLRQILVNLLSNAIKFTSNGHVSFEVGYRMQVATFTIEDSGSGIAEADLGRIFEPFVRGEAERQRFSPGLGLGLTITKLLTETLGGEITVASTVGQGTRFQARLMLAKVERPALQARIGRNVVGYAGARRTIMVVDDNEDHRQLMRELLEPLEFAVVTAESGEACLDFIAQAVTPAPASDPPMEVRHPSTAPHPPDDTYALTDAHPPAVTLGLDPRGHLAAVSEVQSPRVKPEGDDWVWGEGGENGCGKVDTVVPDLYFVDIRMPGMSGWELVTALREGGVTAPIVMLSANIGDGANPTGKDAGHTDTLAKPIDLTQLIDRLGTHLGLEWVHAVPASPAPSGRLVSPGPEHLRELASLGQIGHVRGIEAKLVELMADPRNQPLVKALRRHMEAFDFDGYAETLERVSREPD